MLFKALLVTAVLASIGVPRPREAEAQDCGTTCHSCGLIGYEGRNYSQDGRYNMTCPSASIPYCVACPEVELVADGLPSATVIADELRGASAADIRTVADRYRDRLVVNEERGLLRHSRYIMRSRSDRRRFVPQAHQAVRDRCGPDCAGRGNDPDSAIGGFACRRQGAASLRYHVAGMALARHVEQTKSYTSVAMEAGAP